MGAAGHCIQQTPTSVELHCKTEAIDFVWTQWNINEINKMGCLDVSIIGAFEILLLLFQMVQVSQHPMIAGTVRLLCAVPLSRSSVHLNRQLVQTEGHCEWIY